MRKLIVCYSFPLKLLLGFPQLDDFKYHLEKYIYPDIMFNFQNIKLLLILTLESVKLRIHFKTE